MFGWIVIILFSIFLVLFILEYFKPTIFETLNISVKCNNACKPFGWLPMNDTYSKSISDNITCICVER